MIRETRSRKSNPAITSDLWHVIHARWNGESDADPLFVRSIVSEHDDRAPAVTAARALEKSLAPSMADRGPATRDQIFVRKPSYKSLLTAKRIETKTK